MTLTPSRYNLSQMTKSPEYHSYLGGLVKVAFPNDMHGRLPTESEWEFAARGGKVVTGNPRDNWAEGWQVGNSWQGDFPAKNSLKDGYAGLSPITAFPPNSLGVRLTFRSCF